MYRRTLLAYAAGYFDGEGCITLLKGRTKSGRRYLRIAIVSYDRESLQVFSDLFGNEVKEIRMTAPMATRTTGFRWDKNGSDAQVVLRELIPFLRSSKKAKALEVIRLVYRKQSHHFKIPAICAP